MKTNTSVNRSDFSILPGSEIVHKRAEASKAFDLGLGRSQVITYGEPVHYLSSGKWEDIDNRLALNEKTGYYETRANEYKVSVSSKDADDPLLRLSQKGAEFVIAYLGDPCGAEAELLPPEKYDHATAQDRRADLSATLHSGMVFKDIRPGMDVTVHIGGYGVKDDIVIRNKEAARYAGILLPGGFAYKVEEDGNIHVFLKDEVFHTTPTSRHTISLLVLCF